MRRLRIESDAGTMQQNFVLNDTLGCSAQMPSFADPVEHRKTLPQFCEPWQQDEKSITRA
jgi:hypothetical protein